MRVWVVDRLGLVGGMALGEAGVLLVCLCVKFLRLAGAGGGNIVRTKVERANNVEGDLAVKAKALETNSGDFVAVLIDGLDLYTDRQRDEYVCQDQVAWQRALTASGFVGWAGMFMMADDERE